jgi:predicted nucleic acid-binding protein
LLACRKIISTRSSDDAAGGLNQPRRSTGAADRLTQLKEITPARAKEALGDHAALLVKRAPHYDMLPRIWELRECVTAYDAAYVTLAEALNAPLLTCDGELARSHGHRPRPMVHSVVRLGSQ